MRGCLQNFATETNGSKRMENCIICQKHQAPDNTIIHETDNFIIAHYLTSKENPTMYKGHVFIEPKRHITCYSQINDAESAELGSLVQKTGKALKEELKAEHIYMFSIMHMAPHLHIHMVPRYEGTPKEYWDREVHNWPNAPKLNAEEIKELSIKLGTFF